MKRVLIVSPHFPPINAPDMQRIRMSLPYYRSQGWEPVVMCVGDEWQDGVRETELNQTIPADATVVRVPALSLRWTRLIGLKNIGLRCWLHFLFAGARVIRREKIDLVLFSNTQFVTFTLGRIWRFLYRTPYIFDMQDPWRTDYYERKGSRRPPGGWKYQLARFMAWLLEGWSFRHVSAIMSVSPSYLVDLRARYPFLDSIPTTVIAFGASREDMAKAVACVAPIYRFQRDKGEIHVLYTGASGPVMPHSLTILFQGLSIYHERSPDRAKRLRFHFLGTSYVAPGQGKNSVMPVAQTCGVAEQVEEIPHRLGHLECLRLQSETDILLLPGSSDFAYSPSKVYPYYLTGRPTLGLVFKGSVMEKLLDELACAYMVRFSSNESKQEAYEGLCRFFDLAFEGFPADIFPQRNDAYFNTNFLAETLVSRQCELFDLALAHPA